MKLFRKKKNKKDSVIPLLFVTDGSLGMPSERVKEVNGALSKIAALTQKKLDGYSLLVAVLNISGGAKWLTPGFVKPKRRNFQRIVTGGKYNIGAGLLEIAQKLSKKGFLKLGTTYRTPFIIFITASAPSGDFDAQLKTVSENNLFKHAHKLAFVIDNKEAEGAMRQICGNSELVVSIKPTERILPIISEYVERFCKTANVSASVVKPSSKTAEDFGPTMYMASFDSSALQKIDQSAINSFQLELEKSMNKSTGSLFDEWSAFFDDTAPDHVSAYVSGDPFDDFPKTGADNPTKEPGSVTEAVGKAPSSVTAEVGKAPTAAVCPLCGASLGDGEFCSFCGYRKPTQAKEPMKLAQVQFSAVAPKQIIKGEYAMIDVTVYEDTYRHIVDKIIENADTEVKEVIASPKDIAENTRVRICLSSPDVDVSDCDEEQIWRGKYLTYSFPIEIPQSYAKKQILFTANVYFNGVIATRLKFIASCTTEREQKLSITRDDVLSAFVSYASQDRSRVATIIQGMKKARPDIDVFFDVESLRSGEKWESALYREIEKRDVLFLCWSEFAKSSEWVDKEWRYALSYKGIDAIEPIPLVSPTKCPPPEELSSKHFNDTALLYV